MKALSIIIFIGFHLVLLFFFGSVAAKLLLWVRSVPAGGQRRSSRIKNAFLAACDILFFPRLLRANDILWVGEWLFHLSFVFVVVRHLRYFLDPVPQWVRQAQTAGIVAGFVLPAALLYVAIIKLAAERKRYVSTYNFFLLALIFLLGVTGLLMQSIYRVDIIAAKDFVLGLLSFSPSSIPKSGLLLFHVVLALALFVCLPTHIFAAPLVMFDARQRDEELKGILHDKK